MQRSLSWPLPVSSVNVTNTRSCIRGNKILFISHIIPILPSIIFNIQTNAMCNDMEIVHAKKVQMQCKIVERSQVFSALKNTSPTGIGR